MIDTTKVTLILDGEHHNFNMKKDEVILDIALSNGIDAPHSCQGGVCMTCLGKVTNGKTQMDDPGMLSDEEIDEGLTLTCISKPRSEEITIDYDDV